MDFSIFSNIFSFIYMEFPSFEAMCFGPSAEEQMPCKKKKKIIFSSLITEFCPLVDIGCQYVVAGLLGERKSI